MAVAILAAASCAGVLAWIARSAPDPRGLPPSLTRGGLAEALGLPQQPEDLARRRRHEVVERSVARCMRQAGFDYHPLPLVIDAGSEVGLPATVAEAAARGYGIATGLTPDPDPGAGSRAVDGGLAGEDQAAMTDAQRQAWDQALGRPDLPRSCRGRAEDEADRGLRAVLRDLEVLASAYQRAAEASNRVASLDRRWTRCLALAGYEVSDRAAAVALVDERLTEARLDAGSDGSIAYDPSRLAAAQRFERALAEVDVRCTQPLAAQYQTVRSELADQLRAGHGAEVKRVADALGG